LVQVAFLRPDGGCRRQAVEGKTILVAVLIHALPGAQISSPLF
jgi:hypothetical protein